MTVSIGRDASWFRSFLGRSLDANPDALDPDAPLAALGLDSLGALDLSAQVHEQAGLDLPAPTLLESTIRQLDAKLAAKPGTAPLRPIQRATGTTPASIAQEHIWHAAQRRSAPQTVQAVLRVDGPLDVPTLERALAEVARRHESLRSTFKSVGGDVVQAVAAPPAISLPVVAPTEGAREVADRMAAEEARTSFDLAGGALLRARLVRVSADEHRLVLTAHAIAADPRSMELLARDLAQAYATAPSAEAKLQYKDFAAWQRRRLAGEELDAHVAHWEKQLAGAARAGGADGRSRPQRRSDETILPLPTDLRPAPGAPFRTARHRFDLSPKTSAQVLELARRAKTSASAVFLAALQSVLHRYTAQARILVGVAVANRTRIETRDVVGRFANTLPAAAEFSAGLTFSQLLARVHATMVESYAHRDAPLGLVLSRLKVETAESPPFQVIFAMRRGSPRRFDAGRVQMTLLDAPPEERFAIALEVEPGPERFAGRIHYDADQFSPAVIERLAGHLDALLGGVTAAPDTAIATAPLLTDAERHQLVVAWNDTRRDYPLDRPLHELIEDQIERSPDATAVVSEQGSLTFRELNERANQLAHRLRALGVGPDALVGICVERSLEMVVGLLGILKAGGAYVPLDPEYPKDRLAYMLEDSNPRVLLTQDRLVAALPEHRARVVRLDSDWPSLAAESRANPKSGVKPLDLVYTIYTSGSTGRPKGAMNVHRAVVNRLLWMQEEYRLTPEDRVLQKTPFSFDVSVWEFFWPLLTGARLVMARPGGHRDRLYVAEVINRERITTLHFVPSMLQVFLDGPQAQTCKTLRRVFCSGEALPYELQERFFSKMTAELHNLYGPTEAAVDVTYWACERNSAAKSVPIGRPVANTQMYVLDALRQPVPLGVVGELYIGGIQLARGYLNKAELTAEKFVADPFSGAPGARLYRTGDVARHRPDGAIDYIGRIDHQVKIRGFRIELGEIESVLCRQGSIREAVVLAREDTPGEKRLVAYVVPEKRPAPTTADLRAFLKERLPEYMVPAAFVTLDALPISPNGKVDRRALPAPEAERAELDATFVAPRTPTETALAQVWGKLMKRESVGVEDNLLETGGDSITVTQLATRASEMFDIELSPGAIFNKPTLAGMAELVDELLKGRGAAPAASPAGAVVRTIRHGGRERTVRLHVPRERAQTAPLLVVLHGGDGDSLQMVKLTRGGFDALSDRKGFIVAYPDGVDHHWNDGRGHAGFRAHAENVDDVGFIAEIVAQLSKDLGVDRKRVYVTGASNGGMMAHRIAMERPDLVAAIAPVIASIPTKLAANAKRPARAVPVLAMNGVDDPLVPWAGGFVQRSKELGEVISVPRAVASWVEWNGCSPKPRVTEPDRASADGTRVRVERYEGPAEVQLYAIEGGGHAWPGGEPYLPESVIGRTCRELDACAVIWSFLERYALPS